jgi:hypothetical protein
MKRWIAKPWVKQYLKEAAAKHLEKLHSTCATRRREKAELPKTTKNQKKEFFLLRRGKFVAEVLRG